MISPHQLKRIVHKLHLDDLAKSMNECRKDTRGGFLIPASAKVTDSEYARYRHLPIDWSLPPITNDDLPEEFSPRAVKTVDMFRRKTFNLIDECMIYFDYKTGHIVSCNFSRKSEQNKVQGDVYPIVLKDMHIASLHNHPNQYYSPPSGKNFQMLGFDFEEFELVISHKELWILESSEHVFSEEEIEEIRKDVDDFFNQNFEEVNHDFKKEYHVLDNVDIRYGNYLLSYLNNYNHIKLIRRFLNE